MGTPLSESLAPGDREAFAALYDRLGNRLFATARTMFRVIDARRLFRENF